MASWSTSEPVLEQQRFDRIIKAQGERRGREKVYVGGAAKWGGSGSHGGKIEARISRAGSGS